MPKNAMISQDRVAALIKIVSVVCLIAIAYSIIVMHDAPAKGYEPSIYSSTPTIVWAIMFISVAWGIIVVVQQVYSGAYKTDNNWMIGYALIFITYAIMLCLYIIRGYGPTNIQGDGGSHISMIQQIMATGSVPATLIYPITHIYTAIFAMISSISVIGIYMFIPAAFYIFYIPLFYLFAREILPEKGQAIIASMASLAFLNGVMPFSSDHIFFLPNMLANAILPALLLVFYKFLKTSSLSWGLMLFAMLILYPAFHPLPTMIFMIIILALPIAYIAYRLWNRDFKFQNKTMIAFNIAIFLFAAVWFVQWISYYWNDTVASFLSLIFYGGSNYVALLDKDASNASTYGFGFLNIIIEVVKMMGGALLFGAIALVGLPIIMKHVRKDSKVYNVLALYSPVFFLGILMCVVYFSNFGFGPLRIVEYIGLFCTIIVAYLIYSLISRARGPGQTLAKFALIGAVIVLIAVFINGILGVYPSSYTLSSSVQTTQQELTGMGWLLNDGNPDLSITSLNLAPYRFADALVSPDLEKQWALSRFYPQDYPEILKVPYHFGYNNNSTIGDYFKINLYMIITQMDESTYKDIYPDMAKFRYEASDFDELESDPALNKVYSNSEFDVWYHHEPVYT